MKERRRFADVLDEEAEIKYQTKMEAWGRDDFSVYKPVRVLGGAGEGEEEVTQEVSNLLICNCKGIKRRTKVSASRGFLHLINAALCLSAEV